MKTFGAIKMNTSQWPLIICEWSGTISDDDFEMFLRELELHQETSLSTKQPHALVMDAAKANPMTTSQRKRQTQWHKEREKYDQRATMGTYVVVTSSIIRAIAVAFTWFSPHLKKHMRTFATLDEAIAAASQDLGMKNVAVG